MSGYWRSLVLSVEAESDEHLEKLLELALFELKATRNKKGWFSPVGSTLSLEIEGTMGKYKLDYTKGSKEIVELRSKLLSDGYETSVESEVMDLYATYKSPEKPNLNLYYDPPKIAEDSGFF